MVKYGFYGRLSEKFPSQVIVDVTERCNFACVQCPHNEFENSELYEGKSLDVELNKKLVDEVNYYGSGITQQIRYTANGEPLLHPDITDIVKYATKNSGTFVSLTTNGSLLTNDKAKSLLNANINLIDISIDAYTSNTYSKVTTYGNLNVTLDNVLNLLEKRNQLNPNTRIVVSFVEQPLNKHEVEDFRNYWLNNGVDDVIIRRLHSAGGAKDNIVQKMNNDYKKRKPCVYPWERITLSSKGYLDFCPNSWRGLSHIEDYRNTSICEIWKSDFYKGLRNSHLCNDLSNFPVCEQCPDWQQVRWPGEGRSYGDMITDFLRLKNDDQKT